MIAKAKSITYTQVAVDYAHKHDNKVGEKGIVLDKQMVIGETG